MLFHRLSTVLEIGKFRLVALYLRLQVFAHLDPHLGSGHFVGSLFQGFFEFRLVNGYRIRIILEIRFCLFQFGCHGIHLFLSGTCKRFGSNDFCLKSLALVIAPLSQLRTAIDVAQSGASRVNSLFKGCAVGIVGQISFHESSLMGIVRRYQILERRIFSASKSKSLGRGIRLHKGKLVDTRRVGVDERKRRSFGGIHHREIIGQRLSSAQRFIARLCLFKLPKLVGIAGRAFGRAQFSIYHSHIIRAVLCH